VLVLLTTAAAVLIGCGSPAAPVSAPAVEPKVGEAYRLIQEPGDGHGPVIGVINQARRSIRMTMYELADPDATTALIAAHRRGVDTKVLLDTAFHGRNTNAAAFDQLSAAGVDVRWAPAGVVYHQKTISIDDTETAVGTGNLVAKYYPTSRDAWIIDTNTDDIAAVNATFDADYSAPASGHPPTATTALNLLWSPAARATFVQHIDAARNSVDVTTEELKDRAIVAALGKAAHRGATCRIVLTANPAWTKSIQELTAAGCSIHLIPAGGKNLYMHEKMLLTDKTMLIIGSQNLSTQSLLENRELSLQLDTRAAKSLLDAVASTFDNDYRQAPPAP
jgi:cardiolipin synthase A/B